MTKVKKITVEVPEDILAAAQAETGAGVTETVREGLRRIAASKAQKNLLALRGTLNPKSKRVGQAP